MKKLNGFKTILVAVLSMLGVVGAKYGFELPVDDQAELVSYIMGAAMIVMRLVTKGPVKVPGQNEHDVLRSHWAVGVFVAAVMMLSGCAQLDSFESDPLKKAGAGIVLRHGVDEFIRRDDVPADRAAKVKRYAVIFQSALSRDDTSIESLDSFLISQLPREQMLPGDYQDAVLIIQGVVAVIREEVSGLPEAKQIDSARLSANYFLDVAVGVAETYL